MSVKRNSGSFSGGGRIIEPFMKTVFLAAACVSILCVALICLFLFVNGVPAVLKIGVARFFTGTIWKPGSGLYGIAPMILGSLSVTAGAIITGVPLGVLCAVFMARFCPARLRSIMSPAVTLLAGIPSVVYGFFGLMALVPALRFLGAGNGKSILCASLLLGIMILPTIVSVSEAALRAVPDAYYEGALALGASHEEAVFFAQLPAAAPGVMAGVVLGIGRSIGETMAVIMVAGNQAIIPESIFKGVRTLTANIVLEMGYAADLHREALIATAATLFVFILLINLIFTFIKRRMTL
ncbi:MAG: phosphate ABC transporter permease subunit PstC [Spirochaetaceae bacterium]|jgi:phosphate transport system permease protein|nr:phosphate ABC transporter permease subunit PstC [Spirochaetaceae bacterium]